MPREAGPFPSQGSPSPLKSWHSRNLKAAKKHTNCQHFEVETYAWGVLPPELKQPDLAVGIAEELKWFEREMTNDEARMTNEE